MSVASTHHSAQLLLLQSEVWEVRGHLSALGPTWALGADLRLPAQVAWFSHLILLLPPFSHLRPGPVPATSHATGTAGQSLQASPGFAEPSTPRAPHCSSFSQHASVSFNCPHSLSGKTLRQSKPPHFTEEYINSDLLKVILRWPKPRPRRSRSGLL